MPVCCSQDTDCRPAEAPMKWLNTRSGSGRQCRKALGNNAAATGEPAVPSPRPVGLVFNPMLQSVPSPLLVPRVTL